VRLDNHSEPQPDLAVLLSRKDFYQERHPLPPDTLLVIEVSDSSLRFDRDVKVPLYAQSRIPEVWVVDLGRNRIHFFRHPENGVYTDVSRADKPTTIALTALEGVTVDLSGLFTS
jgi:Uma2 family endonuclease